MLSLQSASRLIQNPQALAHRPGERAPAAQRLPDRDFHPGRAAAAFCLKVLLDSYA